LHKDDEQVVHSTWYTAHMSLSSVKH